ncbi:MSC_0619 family F1-like ATPase alpha subunit [Mycoplasma hafezii]|uniref:MSC_0619 family F1-like ATPase alpha subunit n=1 Tax=Mycoplasma hafezii TaxID=525886 RepID=UPI003CF024D0
MKNPKISAIFDYVIEISGQANYAQNQSFLVPETNTKLMVISATKNKAYCLADKNLENIRTGMEVTPLAETSTVKTPNNIYGKILNINNEILFGANEPFNNFYKSEHSIFNSKNTLLDYEPLTEQLNTGYILIDLLIPIGKGQRELIIGDRKTGKTHIALNTIINQKGKNVKCIYVAIGQQQTQIAAAYNLLKENGALDYTFIIDASSSNPYDQYLAPYIAMAHAENISMEDDVLIVFDNLTNHANVVRELALLINKPVGKEAFPGDMFYTHSRLLERSGKFKNRKSITALPIIQTVENDITSLVASNVISITDGQIVTNSELFASGKIPAIDVELSVSRIGGNVQKPYIAKVASEVAKIYKTYKRQIKLAALKYDLNAETNALINNGAMIEKMFIQKGVSAYTEKAMVLTSKITSWGILNGVTDIALAMKFIDLFIHKNEIAHQTFENILNSNLKDEELAKNFFAFALQEFAKLNNLDWKIKLEGEFVPFNKAEMTQISQQVMEAK